MSLLGMPGNRLKISLNKTFDFLYIAVSALSTKLINKKNINFDFRL